jgi:5'-3' exonuclease
MIRDWVELNMTPGIGPRAAAKLLERFGSAEAVYSATRRYPLTGRRRLSFVPT